MDGFSDLERQTAILSEPSPPMAIATACLGGERRWEGAVRGLFGVIRRRFSIKSRGVMREGDLYFSETLCFDDGETQQREWRIVDGDNGLTVEASDVQHVSSASGPGETALALVYKIRFGALRFTYEDCFRRRPDGVVENIGHVSFAGVRVMTVTASSPKTDPQAP